MLGLHGLFYQALVGIFFYHEKLTPSLAAGIALVLAAIGLLNIPAGRKK